MATEVCHQPCRIERTLSSRSRPPAQAANQATAAPSSTAARPCKDHRGFARALDVLLGTADHLVDASLGLGLSESGARSHQAHQVAAVVILQAAWLDAVSRMRPASARV